MGTRGLNVRALAALLAALAIGISVAGCGDDSDSGAAGSASGGTSDGAVPAGGSLDKEEFVKRANAACLQQSKDYSAEVTQFIEGNAGAEGLTEQDVALAAIKAIVVPITEAQIAAIRRIGAPVGDEEEVEAALAAQEQAIADVMAADEIKSSDELDQLVGDATERLESYGLRGCIFSP